MSEAITNSEPYLVPIVTGRLHRRSSRILWKVGIVAAALLVMSLLVWQAVVSHGNPDPNDSNLSPAAAVLDTGILVFREGLEAILVLAALTASLVRTEDGYWKPVALGAGASFIASVATWYIAIWVISLFNASALHIQAATGLLAIAVLLVIMNWFFHKVYWTGWITHHNRRKRELTETPGRSRAAIFRGLALVGFTAVYREGFEVVLFLQSLRLRAGTHIVLEGVSIGVGLTLIVALLTFVAHYRLPYKKMLVLTGVMLGVVLLVMVGESVQEMQDAGWISMRAITPIPDWMSTWFAVGRSLDSGGTVLTVEGLLAQLAAAVFVIGSYFLARRVCSRRLEVDPMATTTPDTTGCIVPDCSNCEAAREHAVPTSKLHQLNRTK